MIDAPPRGHELRVLLSGIPGLAIAMRLCRRYDPETRTWDGLAQHVHRVPTDRCVRAETVGSGPHPYVVKCECGETVIVAAELVACDGCDRWYVVGYPRLGSRAAEPTVWMLDLPAQEDE